MSLGTILVIILIIFLLGGFSGRFGGYGYGFGHAGVGLIGTFLIIVVILWCLDASDPQAGCRRYDTGRNDRKLFANQPERDTR